MNTNTDPVRAQDYVAVPRAFLEQVYAMAREGCEAPATAYRWCERIDGLFHGGSLDEHDEWARQLPAALASAPPSAPVGVGGLPGLPCGVAVVTAKPGCAGTSAHVRVPQEEGTQLYSPQQVRDLMQQAALAQQPAAPVLAKHQPCGCVICTCEDEQQCQGCGAKHCGNRADHPPYVGQQPGASSGEAVAWLRMTPDGTPDWAEDCIGSDDKFLDPEMASDGYYLQPLYAAPQQPAGVGEAMVEGLKQLVRHLAGNPNFDFDAALADLAARQQEQKP